MFSLYLLEYFSCTWNCDELVRKICIGLVHSLSHKLYTFGKFVSCVRREKDPGSLLGAFLCHSL